jgi:outer membrane usher protein FimD/PapC
MAFGRAAPARSRNLVVTLFSDGRSLGRTELLYDAAFTSFQFISPNFSKYLDSLLLPDERAKAGDSVGYFSSAVMSAAGYVLQVDDNMFELRAAAPPSSKREQRTNLQGGYVRRAVGEAIEPAFFSTLANYRLTGGAMYRWRGDTGPAMFGGGGLNEFSRWPLNLTVDAAATMFDWTLEAAGGANEPYWDQGVTWNNVYRGDVRLVRDIVPWEGRFSLGDVAMSFGGGTVGGARYERNGGFYGKEYDDGSRVSFFMPKAGEVAIFMDGFYRQRIYLPAGRHELTGFGGHTGMNSIRLVLRFVDGTTEEIPYEYILGDLRNLLARETRYSVTAGVARAVAPAPTYYTYDIDDPSLSVDYNYGLTRTLSVGASGASTRHNNVARVQASVDMGPVGWSSAGLSANYAPDSVQPARSYGWRADASYMPKISLLVDLLSYIIRGGEATGPVPAVSLSVRGYFQSPYYNPAAFSAQPLLVTTMGGVSGNLGFSLFRGSVMASAGATVYRPDSTGAAAPMSYNYGGRIAQTVLGVPVSVSGGMEVSNGVGRPYFSVAMSHGFGMGANYNSRFRGHQIRVTSGLNTGMSYTPAVLREVYPDPDTAQGDIGIDGLPKYELVEEELNARVSGNAGVGWQWSNGGTGIGAQTYMASASVPDILNPTIPGVSAGMQRTMNRGSLTAGYTVAFADGGTQRHSLSAALAGSLMMADGVWALGRQTTGGFILVDTRYSLKGARVHVDRSHFYEQDYSRSGWFGAAYKADVTGYVPTSITITLTDPPPGAVLENNLYFATGGYKQGFALRLGSLYSVMLEARFTDRGAPLAYTYATVTPEGDMDKSGTRATFTSSAGILQLGGLLPGETYRISFGSGIKDILLEIPANTDLVYEPSDIAVERE